MRSRLDASVGAALLVTATLLGALGACNTGPGKGTAGSAGSSEDGPGCPDDAAFFQDQIYTPILGQKCIVCHAEGGLAKQSHLVLDPSGTPEAQTANFETVRDVARMNVNGQSVLLLRPTGMHPDGHTGGQVIDLGGPAYKALSAFVDRVTKGKCDSADLPSCDAPARGNRMLRRLSRSEYDATVHDLFGIPSAWGEGFSPDTVVNGFDNNASALVVSPLLADQARRAAEEIADKVFQSPGALLPCDPATGDAACAAAFVDTFGKRAFRRPLETADHDRYMALYTLVATDDGFLEGVKTVLSAMLQSPHFLYRTELGGAAQDGVVKLTPHEIASELSYLFWGTLPDAELFAAADANKLGTPEEIASQAERLLADPRSDAVLDRFVDQWLLVGNVVNVPKDASVYPDLTPSVRAGMRDEIRALYRRVLRGETPTLPALFASKKTYVSPDLATYYGLPSDGSTDADGLLEVDLTGTERAGLLTQGALLATHAHPNDSSPIHRGKLVRTRLLCQKLPPPPAGFNVQPPPLDPDLTTRERYIAHSTVEPCKSCHELMDPIGFGFERFDGAGRYRSEENGKPIDASGEIVQSPATNGAFDGVAGLSTMLAESPDTAACFSLQWLRFAYGIEESVDTQCLVQGVAQDFEKDGLRLDTLLTSLVQTAHFLERKADPDVSDTPSSGGAGGGGGDTGGAGQGASGQGGMGGGGPVSQDLTVTVHQDSQWQAGHCDTVTVLNAGAATVTWQITLAVDGTITDLWNAKSTPAGDKLQFEGVDYNAVLDAGESTTFGYCATY